MAPINPVLETFEGKAKRTLWLPPITLGYIFTLSGSSTDFWLTVVAIGGARLFIDITDSDLVVESENGERVRPDAMQWFQSNFSNVNTGLYGIVAVLYACAVPYGLLRLHHYFTHEDPVLVGLAAIYWGILVVVVMNV